MIHPNTTNLKQIWRISNKYLHSESYTDEKFFFFFLNVTQKMYEINTKSKLSRTLFSSTITAQNLQTLNPVIGERKDDCILKDLTHQRFSLRGRSMVIIWWLWTVVIFFTLTFTECLDLTSKQKLKT